ncbi:hypothetical protein DIS24_g11521 [Lasiodiplodia hormozganensis]|uniref:Uncharacterized protein n=1 Tax=Lasiodiplodia hormozganensis TaxID=869390 RepID=A0AA39WP24_9PEZI|nr:hypothetical protein DIS24_g11521 [Lasiodiplodia hormozganensis]
MTSRLLPRPFQARLTTTILPPTRALSARSARAARLRRRQPTTSSTSTSAPSPSHPPAATPIPNTNTYPATASPRSSLLDPTDPLNLLGRPQQRRDDHQPAIHFFEQDVSQIGESAPQPVNLARMEADEARAAELRAKIARLESEIDQIENSDEAELDATLMRLRAVYNDDAVDVGGGVKAAEGNGEVVELLGDAEPEQVRAELEALRVRGVVSGSSDKRIKESVARLNNCLRHAYLATDPQARPVIRQELWKAYKRAKMMHAADPAALLERIPPPAWDLLFYSQAVRWKSNEKRDEHVRELLADMKSVGMDGPPTSPPDGKKPLEVVD